VAAGLLAAVGGAGRQARVALAAHLLLPVVLLGQRDERGLHDAAAQLEFNREFARHFFCAEEFFPWAELFSECVYT